MNQDKYHKNSLNINNTNSPLNPLNTREILWKSKETKDPRDSRDPKRSYIFLAIVLLIGFAFYFFNNQKEEINVLDTTIDSKIEALSEEGENIKLDFADLEGQKINDITDSQNVDNIQKVNNKKEKFNLAMKKAQDAFLVGNYKEAISFYNNALTIQESDFAYAGLFTVYSAQNDWTGAMIAIDKAIELSYSNTDYWIWKIQVLNEKTGASINEQKKVYEEGLTKTNPLTRVNLVTTFARILENNGQKSEAIELWEYAKELYPFDSDIYQKEINRLKAS